MGVSTVASYTGAQIFEAIGLGRELVDEYFTGTVSRLGGIGLDEIAAEVAARHAHGAPEPARGAGPPQARARRRVPVAPRGRGAPVQPGDGVQAAARHSCEALRHLQAVHRARRRPVEAGSPRCAACSSFTPGDRPADLDRRGRAGQRDREAVQHRRDELRLDQRGGARDAGDRDELDRRARATPARAARTPTACTTRTRRSAIKQVASGRFGVTSEYLVNADDLQIKMAQGAKPGEGGQLPGHKVYPWVAKTRHSTPGVGLISPPPHHDIYSIEDLKQLIHDLKNSNPLARVHVKLVGRGRRRHGGRRREQGQGRRGADQRPRRRHRRHRRSPR